MTIGIMSVMCDEIQVLLNDIKSPEVIEAGKRSYYKGILWGTPVVIVFPGWGKVASATTSTYLIEHFGVNRMIFTGVAGGVNETMHAGDVVVASKLYNESPNGVDEPQDVIPLWDGSGFRSDLLFCRASHAAATKFLEDDLRRRIAAELLVQYRIRRPKVVEGYITGGDYSPDESDFRTSVPHGAVGVACVEMEGAAMAQVCQDYSVSSVVIRTISESIGEGDPDRFHQFVKHVASTYSRGILKNLLTSLYRPQRWNSAHFWPRRAAPCVKRSKSAAGTEVE
jgi:adenosylhomocysteine nucleosidase